MLRSLQTIVGRREQIPVSHVALLRQHETTRDLELTHLAKLQRLRVDQMQEQYGVENINQDEYTKRLRQELLSRHSAEQKQMPKNVKVSREDYEIVLVHTAVRAFLHVVLWFCRHVQ